MKRMVCLDTNFMTLLWKNDPDTIAFFLGLPHAHGEVKTTAVNMAELYVAAYNSRRPHDFEKVRAFEAHMRAIPFDLDAARLYGEIASDLKKRGLMINVQDIVMASIAMSRGEKVVTRDRHFRRIRGLDVIEW